VTDGIIQVISVVVTSDFPHIKLWIPSPIQMIQSKLISQNEHFKSAAFENVL
jgi:hypothetical protein